jgi:hypothetical protein
MPDPNRIIEKAALSALDGDSALAVDTPSGLKKLSQSALQASVLGASTQAVEVTAATSTTLALGALQKLKFVSVSAVPTSTAYTHTVILPAGKLGDRIVFALSVNGAGSPVTLRFSAVLAESVIRDIVCPYAGTVTAEYDGTAWQLVGLPAPVIPVGGKWAFDWNRGILWGRVGDNAWRQVVLAADPGLPDAISLVVTGTVVDDEGVFEALAGI